jgi:DNA repair exonuclease SbcCD ATPase subunit
VSGRRYKIILFSLLLTAAAQSVRAESVGKVVNEGNKLYWQGQYKEAINEYGKAATQSPEVIEPRFNKADSYFRLDDLQQAIDLYKAVAAESKDMQLVEKAKYNLGNCLFKQGSKLKDSDLQKALESMQTAIGCWRQVLDIDPTNEKAAKNIEVARLTIKDIIDQINRRKQQQQQHEQQQKQTQEDLKQLLEQQKSLADKTQQAQQQPSPDYNEISKEQSALKDRTEQVKQKLQQQNDPNNPDQKQQQAAEQLEKATDKQKDAAEKLKNSDAAGGKKSQDEAAKDIEKALKSLSDQQDQNQQQKQQEKQQQNSQQQKQQEPNQPQEPNQAQQQQQEQQQQEQQVAAPDTTAEEILDREQKQKEQRQMLQSPGFQKVDKDW